MARGGRRIGAGRKPKVWDGNGARVLNHPSSVVLPSTNGPAEVEEFDAPDSLSPGARAVWLTQAPHAFRNGTLKRATAMAFERYCELVVLERNERGSTTVGGANHRGLLKEVRSCESHFKLIAEGKPFLEQPAVRVPVDEDDAFFGGPHVAGHR